MRKLPALSIILTFCLFFLFSRPALAKITITKPDDPILSGKGNFNIIFESNNNELPDDNYHLLVGKAGEGVDRFNKFQNQDTKDPDKKEDNRLTFLFANTDNDVQSPGVHKFELWTGRSQLAGGTAYLTGLHKLLITGSYRVAYEDNTGSAGDTAMYVKCDQVQTGVSTPLYILNPDSSSSYSLWVDNALRKSVLYSGNLSANESITDKVTGKDVKAHIHNLVVNTIDLPVGISSITLCLEQSGINISKTSVGLTCRWKLPLKLTDKPVDPATCKEKQSNATGAEGPVSSGQKTSSTPTPIPTPIYPPCIEGIDKNDQKVTIPTLKSDNSNKDEVFASLGQLKKCTKVSSAIGNINTDAKGFILTIFTLILSIAGGVAVLILIRAGYKYMVSQGNPEQIKAAQEEITSAIVGLLFIVFSMVLLQVVGVDILQLPGMTR